jgi:hypothetical protein
MATAKNGSVTTTWPPLRLTLFTIPKAFDGPAAVIQRNALRSWAALGGGCEILVLGDDAGVAEAAREIGARHVGGVARSEAGTPLVNSIFELAEGAARTEMVCYVNADIILMSDFLPAAGAAAGRFRRFLMVSRRWNMELNEALEFGPGWEGALRARVAREARIEVTAGIDYFLYRRGLFSPIPPFAIGRAMWDNWLLYRALARGAELVDATEATMIVHPNHGYAGIRRDARGTWSGPEVDRNMELAGGHEHHMTLDDAGWRLTAGGAVRVDSAAHRDRAWARRRALYPRLYRIECAVRRAAPFVGPLARRIRNLGRRNERTPS